MLSSRPGVHAIKVLIAEVGYSSKLGYKEKMQALDQHKQLMQAQGYHGIEAISFYHPSLDTSARSCL